MYDKKISISEWTKKSSSLLENARRLMTSLSLDTSELPTDVFDNQKPISLVFAGQYSAGKSTLIKSLTGIDTIEIGEGITTQEVQEYEWNGIKIIDTPGIHTTLRPDHDEKSYKAISEADMLVYVITHNLFDPYIGQKFQELLIDKEKAGEMILVVNKMADVGNTPEMQQIKLEDLRKVTADYSPEYLRTCFVDGKSYLKALSSDKTNSRERLIERSNYDVLVDTINKFVAEKHISAKLTTAIYKIYDVLQLAINNYEKDTSDINLVTLDAIQEHLLQKKSILRHTQHSIENKVCNIYQEAAAKISERGRQLASRLSDFKDENEANDAITIECNEVDNIAKQCETKIIDSINSLSEANDDNLDSLESSDFTKEIRVKVNNEISRGNPLLQKILSSDAFVKGGNVLISGSVGPNAAASGLKAFSGSSAHQVVLKAGHFFGHSFKPWEAVKVAKGINVAGKALSIFGMVLSFGMQIKEDIDEYRLEEEMRTNRDRIRSSFNDAANAIIDKSKKSLSDYIKTNYLIPIERIDNQIYEIQKQSAEKSENCQKLLEAQNDCRKLIADIHNMG